MKKKEKDVSNAITYKASGNGVWQRSSNEVGREAGLGPRESGGP